MKIPTKEWLFWLLALLVVIQFHTMYTHITLAKDIAQGKRVDPFRCSDAAYYFAVVDVEVDCKRIEQEVNE